jgi:hypothetical protein
MLLHALLTARLTADSGGGEVANGAGRLPSALIRRFDDIGAAPADAAAHGERAPSGREFFDIALAPPYASLLFDARPGRPETVEPLIARLVHLVADPHEGGGRGDGGDAPEEGTA